MDRGFIITGVRAGTPAEKAGIKEKDRLLKINDSYFYDLLDYHFLCSENKLKLSIRKKDGRLKKIWLKKKYNEDLGLEFSSPTIGPLRRCKNRCVFCFVDQQPPEMRSSLFEKDDDYRLSFLHGNYISLTNMGELDIRRIIRRGISPLYISIHSTDRHIRCKMMGNRFAGGILAQLTQLARYGIEMHGQVVVCPGFNDGIHLEKTVRDLAALFPSFQSVALVPVGLTRYRKNLSRLRCITPAEVVEIVKKFSDIQEEYQKKFDTPFVYLADEFYLLSGFQIPADEHYGAYQQVENGVGLARLFLNELDEWKRTELSPLQKKMEISIVTGQSGAPFLKLFVSELEQIRGLTPYLHVLPNIFWGGNVTVTGLLTGSDLLFGLSQKHLGEILFIPSVMLKEGTDLFLDNISLSILQSRLKVKIVPVKSLAEIRAFLTNKAVAVTG